MRNTGNITLATLAKKLNVTTTTVSKALRGKPGIGPEMVRKVQDLARELNYQPNFAAQSLKKQSSDSIGLLITSDITNPWYAQLVSCIESELASRGKTMILSLGKNDDEKERKCLEAFRGGRVGGVIVGPIFRKRNLENIWHFFNTGIPMVLFNCMDEMPVNYVAIDQSHGAKIAIEYLIKMGHRNIAYHGCPSGDCVEVGKSRKEGYMQALFENDIPLAGKNITTGFSGKTGSYKAMKEMLKNRGKDFPTAFFCHNDEVALGAMLAIQQAGLSVPGDISLVGFDDIEESILTMPQLTTVGGVMLPLASGLVETIHDIIEEKPEKSIKKFITPEFIERKSVKKII